jgi:hypothetical protein
MKFVLKISGSEDKNAEFVGWTPVKCTLTVDGYNGNTAMPVTIFTDHTEGKSGKIDLYLNNATSAVPVSKINHDFQNANELTFYVAGRFGHASVAEKDTVIFVVCDNDLNLFLFKPLMVRVRKNANLLTQQEIDDFLLGFLELSKEKSRGVYSENDYSKIPKMLLDEIILMHTIDAKNEIHRRTSFHPWHRVFQMHIEREIQNKHPHVTIPYWKFDEPAQNVFTEKFIGKTKPTLATNPGGNIHYGEQLEPDFDSANPLFTYSKHVLWGGALKRAYRSVNPAVNKPEIADENTIICQGNVTEKDDFSYWSNYEEENSHNNAHWTFTGNVVDIGKDPMDPLFFMMHANVDRLWALWQHEYDRFDAGDIKTYPLLGKYNGPRGEAWRNGKNLNSDGFYDVGKNDVGNYADDTLWPWDFDNILSRPMREWASLRVGYGAGKVPQIKIQFPSSLTSKYPQDPITVKSTIDYQDRVNNQFPQGFDYDFIPYFTADRKSFCTMPKENINNKIENFFDKNKGIAERLQFINKSYFRTEDEKTQVLNIVFDKNEDIEIRVKSVKLIDETNVNFLDNALKCIADESEATELRSELIHLAFASNRSNPFYPSYKPDFFNILRGLLRSSEPQLRFQSIDLLASQQDEVVQEFLVEELKKDSSNFISKQDAIFFLRENPKPNHAKIFRQLIGENKDTNIRKAAIEGLGNDPESEGFLKEVVLNDSEDFKVREASALSLHNLNHELMNELAAQIIAKPEPGEGIKLFRSTDPDPDEVDFKAGLLNMLTFTGDVNKLKNNEELKSSLREVNLPSTQNKANFKTTLEAFTDKSIEEPTILEQMSKKLLTRIESKSNE